MMYMDKLTNIGRISIYVETIPREVNNYEFYRGTEPNPQLLRGLRLGERQVSVMLQKHCIACGKVVPQGYTRRHAWPLSKEGIFCQVSNPT